jgi:hypothetical protein
MHLHQESGHISGSPHTLRSGPEALHVTASAVLPLRHPLAARAIVLSFKHEARAAA